MKIVFIVNWNSDDLAIPALFASQSVQHSGKVICVDDSPEGIQKMISVCSEETPESVVLLAAAPFRFRDDHQLGLMQGLVDLGVNPASVEFINTCSATVFDEDAKQCVKRLSLCAQLAQDRIAHSSPLLQKKITPVHRCLVLGDVSDADISTLTRNNIEVIRYWGHQKDQDATKTVIISFSGVPGRYTIGMMHNDENREDLFCGAVLLNENSLDDSQKKQLTEILKIPLPSGVFKLPPARHLWTRGIWLVGEEKSVESIISLLAKKELQVYFDVCTIDLSKCGLCGTCVKTCMFSCNYIQPETNKLMFSYAHCTGCGNCVTACPVLARDLHHYSNNYMGNIARYTSSFQGCSGIKILALFCENNGYKAVNQLAEADQQVSSSYFFLPVKCGARLGTEIIPDSFQAGFDGVALLVCARDECDNLVGSLDLERRFNLYRTIMKAQGQESGRLRIFSIKEGELGKVSIGLEQFADYLQKLQVDQTVFSKM